MHKWIPPTPKQKYTKMCAPNEKNNLLNMVGFGVLKEF